MPSRFLQSCVADKPAPKPVASCVDVLLYDTYGDGWGLDTFLQYNNESYALLSDWQAGVPISNGSQCSTRVHRFCSDDSKFSFRLNDFSVAPSKGWEVFFAVKYLGKLFYGTVGTEIVIDGFDVEFEKIFDAKPPKNKCARCPHEANGTSVTFSLNDARGKSWYTKAGPVVDIAGFEVPAVLVYPKYFITRTPDTPRRRLLTDMEQNGRLISEGSLCDPKGGEVCVEGLENGGNYKFFVSGRAQGDETWSFCNTSGVVGEELHFRMEDGVCYPERKTSAELICVTPPAELSGAGALSPEDALDAELLDSAVAPSAAMTVEIVAAGSIFVMALLFVVSKVFKKQDEIKFVELAQSSTHAAGTRDIVF